MDCFISHKSVCSLRVDYKQRGRMTFEIKENDSNSFIIDKSEISISEFCFP